MLMDIRCKAISSILCHMTYDDGTKKDCLVALHDLVDVFYNGNGMRKHIVGRVADISTVGTDPHNWYIIVDGSDDFASQNARFSPLQILNISIIRKADQDAIIRTPLGETGIPYLRIVKGRLQWSPDGFKWLPIKINDEDIIEPQEGTVPVPPRPHHNPDPDYDGIMDANY